MRKAQQKTLMRKAPHEVTELLQDWSQGDESALERLMPLVYNELHRLTPSYAAGKERPHSADFSVD